MKKLLLFIFALFLSASSLMAQVGGCVITNKPSGGSIGTAAVTVDVCTKLNLNQTTALQTLTIPSPTTTTISKTIEVSNVGSVDLTLSPGGLLPIGKGINLRWIPSTTSWSAYTDYSSGGGSAPSDAAYGIGWDGVTTIAPSKNSIYDKVETLVSKTTGTVLFANPSSSVLNITSDNGALAKSLVSIDNGAMTVGYNLAGGGSFLQLDGSGATIQSNGTSINIQNTGAPISLNSDVGIGVIAPYLSLQTTGSVANFKATNVTAPIDIECQDGSGTIAYLTDIPSVSGVYLPLAGGTMGGDIDMGSSNLTNVSYIINGSGPINLLPAGSFSVSGGGDILLSSSTGVDISSTAFNANLQTTALTANRLYTFPNAPGQFVLNDNAATLTNKTISGASNTLSNIAQSSVTNLTSDLSGKQATLVSGTNIKTVNSTTLLGSGNITTEVPLTFSTGITRSTNTITVNTSQNIATLSNLTSNGYVKTSGGTGTLGVSATIPNTDITGLGTLSTQSGTFSGTSSGTNTGDNAVNSLYSGLVSNATHTGDATGSTALTVVKINGTSLAGLATGLLKNTTGTGVPSIAIDGTDYLTPTGTATLGAKTINGISNTFLNIPLSSAVTGQLPTANAGVPTGGTTGQVLAKNSNTNYDYSWTTVGGSGTVTDASVVTANGFSGSVATSTTTPAITINTTVTGIPKGNGTGFTAATAGTDYALPITIASAATDADYTAVVNTIKHLPASTLTANRTITIPSGTNGDILEIYNNDSGFAWNLSGASVYLADRSTVVTSLQYNYPTFIKYISGLWIITN